MKFGSLFTGFGGLDLGLERAGMACQWQVENNEYAKKKSFKNIGPTSSDFPMSEEQEPLNSALSISSAGVSPAKISALPVRAQASRASVRGSGSNSDESLKSYHPLGCSSKTCPPCEPEGSPLCSVTFTRSGTMQNGMVWPRPTSAPLTNAIGSSWLPTPCASDGEPRGVGKGEVFTTATGTKRLRRPDGRTSNLGLANQFWATPTVKGNYNRKGLSVSSGDGLATQVGGALNPTWVEWLMGFPMGWSDSEG